MIKRPELPIKGHGGDPHNKLESQHSFAQASAKRPTSYQVLPDRLINLLFSFDTGAGRLTLREPKVDKKE